MLFVYFFSFKSKPVLVTMYVSVKLTKSLSFRKRYLKQMSYKRLNEDMAVKSPRKYSEG